MFSSCVIFFPLMISLENLKGFISCVILTYDEAYFSLRPLVDLGLNKGLFGISVKHRCHSIRASSRNRACCVSTLTKVKGLFRNQGTGRELGLSSLLRPWRARVKELFEGGMPVSGAFLSLLQMEEIIAGRERGGGCQFRGGARGRVLVAAVRAHVVLVHWPGAGFCLWDSQRSLFFIVSC